MGKPVAFAIAAHPDDIELMMAGTLLLLGKAGYELHMMNVSNGCCGTATDDLETIVRKRTEEAKNAAKMLGAQIHPPIANDIEIFYTKEMIQKVCAVIREISPAIMLVQSPQDYMEDHMNACRIAVTAAFCRGMRNYASEPARAPISTPVSLYHALPWGLRGPLRELVQPDLFIDISMTIDRKREALACHKSQKEWLDHSQGLDSYLTTMVEMSREVGKMSGKFEYAEGWRRHLHLGFCGENDDPLRDALGFSIAP
jgi:LmbE family N-acetylglucosaminyl deacetylase